MVKKVKENGQGKPQVRIGKLSDFRPQVLNANQHTERGLRMLDDSMSEDGYVAPMTAVADGEVIDGSARLERAFDRFSDEAIILEHDGTRPIITKRIDIPDADNPIAKRIALRANRIAEADLSWNPEVLAELAELDPNTVKGMFSDKELAEILSETASELKTEEDERAVAGMTDRASALREKWNVERGQVWEIGRHRLLCGDSTQREEVRLLLGGSSPDCVFTSPPYNSNSELHGNDKFRGSFYLTKQIDALTPEQFRAFQKSVFAIFAEFVKPTGSIFYNFSYSKNNRDGYVHLLADAIASGFHLLETIIWLKRGMPNPAALDVLTRDYEFIFLLSRSGSYKSQKQVGQVQSNVWQISNDSSQIEQHKACFPVALPAKAIADYFGANQVIFEPFCGSGTTIVAAEAGGCSCYAVEQQAEYCAVTLERLSTAFPHLKIEKVDQARAA